MRKSILYAAVLLPLLSGAQVIMNVQSPAELVGNYEVTVAAPADGWAGPDMTDPANAFVANLAFAYDATATTDSLCCEAVINGTDIAGKMAVLYRGTCNFSVKALNAQNAGAQSVLIINNVAGAPIVPGAGTDAGSVNIPVFMIGQEDGAALHDAIAAGTVNAFFGNKMGFFAHDIGMAKADALIPRASAIPHWIANNASEFNVQLGGWVRNYGNQDQTGVTLSATVSQDGTTLYTEAASPVDIVSGDSAFVTLPDFSQDSYSGLYEMQYTLGSPAEEEYTSDNTFSTNFIVDSVLGYAPIDPATKLPRSSEHYRPAASTNPFESCVAMFDPNGGRLAALGLHVTATTAAGTSLDGKYLEARAYYWSDEFTGISDVNFPGNAFTTEEEAYGIYYYTSDAQSASVYIPFEEPVVLQDDIRYLFCVSAIDPAFYLGYNGSVDYDEVVNLNDQPVSVLNNNGTWYSLGFGTDITSSVSVQMAQSSVGIAENSTSSEVQAYPNPARDLVRVPLKGFAGNAALTVSDMQGRVVMERNVVVNATDVQINIGDLCNGSYRFDLRNAQGGHAGFRVVVSK